MKRPFLIISCFAVMAMLFYPAICSAEYEETISGLSLYNSGNFPEAIVKLESSLKEAPLIEEYILLYIARAKQKSGDTEGAVTDLETIIKKHPKSPVIHSAKDLLVDCSVSLNPEKGIEALRKYTSSYPKEYDRKFQLANLLRENGQSSEAYALLKDIYISGGSYSSSAGMEIDLSGLSVDDLVKRGNNLASRYMYADAEKSYRAALKRPECTIREVITKKLAYSLFRQRRYPEAAAAYQSAFDPYNYARSLYRAGDLKKLEDALAELENMRDPRVVNLLIASAIDIRRRGDAQASIKRLEELRKKYPSKGLLIQWHIGWAHYLEGDYDEALEIFTKLYRATGSPNHKYWMARAFERTGQGASHLYTELSMENDNYYAALSYIKLDDTVPAGSKTQKSLDTERYLNRDVLDKANVLEAVGLSDEAAMELKSTGWSVSSFDDIISVSLKLADMGRFRDAISISTRLPKSKRPEEVLYPHAFWKTISRIAGEYNIDPLLVLSIIREESRFDTSAYSPAGAMGLMQLMPSTAKDLSQRLGMRRASGNALYNVETNVRLGSYYLSRLIKEFGSVHPAIAAYNAGESNVRRWLNARKYSSYDEFIEDIPYPETRKYLMRIINSYAYYKRNGVGGM